ncbi:MAG: isochorismatase family protein [Desertimonas sp.]
MRHDWRIDEREYRRHESRRGRRHAYVTVSPTRTALVVVDMIPFFLDENPYARGIVPNIDAIASRLRDAGGTVAWVLPATGAPTPAMIEFYGADVAASYSAAAGTGPLRDRLSPELRVTDRDLIVEKRAAGAFVPGHCDLDDQLQARDIDTVLVTGTVANVCCESTAREASFGDVRTTDEVLDLIDVGAP